MSLFKKEIKKVLLLGAMCMLSYLAVYFARNILSYTSNEMIEEGMTHIYIGILSTSAMISYAVGQLINGILGDKISVKYMVGGGLFLSGICNFLIPFLNNEIAIVVVYSLSSFFLSMIYAPIVKTVSENTSPKHAVRCTLGFTIASLIGVPLAGVVAIFFNWGMVFLICGIILMAMGISCYVFFEVCERKKIIKKFSKKFEEKKKTNSLKILIKNDIVRFALVSALTGIVRTSVVFWIPTYLAEYLSYSKEEANAIASTIALIESFSPYLNTLVIYELLFKRNMTKSLISMFSVATIGFVLMFIVMDPIFNIVILVVTLTAAHGASTMLWSVYCPSLRDTGMVSSATGFLDFVSYGAAALANILFADAVTSIGWNNLILIWAGLMLIGVFISIPYKFLFKRKEIITEPLKDVNSVDIE